MTASHSLPESIHVLFKDGQYFTSWLYPPTSSQLKKVLTDQLFDVSMKDGDDLLKGKSLKIREEYSQKEVSIALAIYVQD